MAAFVRFRRLAKFLKGVRHATPVIITGFPVRSKPYQ